MVVTRSTLLVVKLGPTEVFVVAEVEEEKMDVELAGGVEVVL